MVDARAGQQFYVGGLRVPDSRRFQLSSYSGTVDVRVKPGSRRALGAGMGMLFGGVGAVPAGTGILLAGLGKEQAVVFTGAGIAMLGIGLMVAGGVVWTGAGSTTYELAPSRHLTYGSNRPRLRPMISASGVGLGF